MNEEYSVNENNQQSPEFQTYSELNAESNIGEFEQYATEYGYVPNEFQTYESAGEQGKLSRHSTILRNNKNRLGRLLAMLAAIVAPVLLVILIASSSVFVDVRGYTAEPELLEVKLSLYSSSSDTEFNAVLTDRDGNVVGEQYIDRNVPILLFTGLEPGDLYYLEVYADGESRLRLNYILPEYEKEGPEPGPTGEPGHETGQPGGPTDPPDGTPADPDVTPTAPDGTPFDQPTGEPTTEPTAVQEPVIMLSGEESKFESFTLTLTAEYIDTADLRAKINGREAQLTPQADGSTVTLAAEGLVPDTEYPFVITDKDGKELYSGSIRTAKRTPAQVTLQLFTSTLTWTDIEFIAVNPDGNKITAKFDGQDYNYTKNGNLLSFVFNGLEVGSTHRIDFYDWNGSLILSYPFTTRSREGASVSVTTQTVGIDSASITFAITNPDNNALSVRYDGTVIESALTAATYNFSRTGLVRGVSHMIEFLDWDGTVIYTYSFTPRARRSASVSVASQTLGYNNASISFNISNPDGNELTVRYDGTVIESGLTSTSYSFSRSGLVSGATHRIEFLDWDGSVIFTHTFAARSRNPAAVSFSNVSAGYNSISVGLSVSNPDSNELELRVNGNRVNANLSSASPTANITGLNPRTSYTITVQDVSCGTTVATTTATTVTSVNWSQDGSGNTTFTLTDAFASLYPNAAITVTDSLGYQVKTTSPSSKKFYVSANDSVYSDSYTVKVTSGGSTIDTLTASLSGKTRPVIDMKYENYGPATLAEAKENGYSWISYPGYRYQLKSGYVAPVYVSDDENDFEIISGNTHWTALVIKDSTDKVVRMAITGIGIEEEKITLTGNDRITFWPLGGNYDDALVGTYTAALYTADGYTEDQMDTMFRDATDSENYEDALPVINAFTSSGRRVSKVVSFVIEEDNYKGDGYIDVNSSEVIRGEMRVTANISYYGNDDEEGFYVFVSASDPTVLLSDPVSLGTGSTYGYSIDPTYLRTTDPVYMILYTGSFSPENYLVVNYITPQ